MFSFNPFNWYWLADDGRVYASNRQLIVDDTDAEYVAWAGAGGVATAWPRDEEGNQTNDAMQAVVGNYGLFVDLTYYTASVREKTIVKPITVNGRPFATDPITVMSLNSAYIHTQGNAASTFSWKLPDSTWVTLNKADVSALHDAVSGYGQAVYDCEADTQAAIAAGTITDRAAIDAAFAAVENSFNGLEVRFEERKPTQAQRK